ncbi:MAG: hypothetical protein LBJ00_02785 [Planctomycetaceae bacterium]|jgi:hypothetical protein|nr:hypothetical protein [Planctomycetaceae bacterium]
MSDTNDRIRVTVDNPEWFQRICANATGDVALYLRTTLIHQFATAANNTLGFRPASNDPVSIEGIFASSDGREILSVPGIVVPNDMYSKDVEYSYTFKNFSNIPSVLATILRLNNNKNKLYHPKNYNCTSATIEIAQTAGIANVKDGVGKFYFNTTSSRFPVVVKVKATNPLTFAEQLLQMGGKRNLTQPAP